MDRLGYTEWTAPGLRREAPWADEPDIAYWIDGPTGVHCLVRRAVDGLLHLCGYVGVRPPNPLHGEDYDNTRLNAHGGLTFAGCFEDLEGLLGVPADVWWLGFDCAHLGDLVPGMQKFREEAKLPSLTGRPDVYRDFEYVAQEVASLVEQIDNGVCMGVAT